MDKETVKAIINMIEERKNKISSYQIRDEIDQAMNLGGRLVCSEIIVELLKLL